MYECSLEQKAEVCLFFDVLQEQEAGVCLDYEVSKNVLEEND